MDQVALIFGWLYKHYTDITATALITSATGTSPVQAILNSLDAFWAKIDHDLFLVAIALNPFIKTKVFAPAISPMLLVTMIE